MLAADYGKPCGFTIHISTSDLVQMLVVDSEALKNEHHEPGVYDESGDYVPQFSDDPRDLEHITPNPSTAPGASEGNENKSAEPSPEVFKDTSSE